MSANNGFTISLSLNSKEVNFILAESYRLENAELIDQLKTLALQRALQQYSSVQLRGSLASNFSYNFSFEDLKWLYQLIRCTTSSDYEALRVNLSNKFDCLAEDLVS